MSARLNVLIPDGDSTWSMAVIHCIMQVEIYSLFVLSNSKHTAAKYSKYTQYYKYHNRSSKALWLDTIIKEVELNDIDIIVPIAEDEISFFIENRSKISDHTTVIPLPELSSFATASDKNALSEFCEIHKLPHPKSRLFSSNFKAESHSIDIDFPILIKPLDQKGGDGILKINDYTDFIKQIDSKNGDTFIQEYISGYDIDCSVLCSEGEILYYTIQKGNLKGHNDFAPQLGFELFENNTVRDVVKTIMSKLNWSGIAHLDLRYDEVSKRYFVIEINPRFWGSIGASLNAGVNFPHLAIQLALHNRIDEVHFKPTNYMRLKGVIKSIRRQPGLILKRKYLLEHTEVNLFIKDPLPTMYRFVEWLKRQF